MMNLNIDMLESLVLSAVGVAEEATMYNDLPRDLAEQIQYLTICLQRLKEESNNLTPERWAEFLEQIDKTDTYII